MKGNERDIWGRREIDLSPPFTFGKKNRRGYGKSNNYFIHLYLKITQQFGNGKNWVSNLCYLQ